MRRYYKYAHVTPKEEITFAKKKRFNLTQRKYQYAKGVLRKKVDASFLEVNDAVRWKFGSGISRQTYYKASRNKWR